MPDDLLPLGLAIKRVQDRHHRALDAALVEIGTTLAQWHALGAIQMHPDSSSHKLAGLTFQTDQSFGALANRMVDRCLIRRVAGEGRAILHHLTPAGEKMLAAAMRPRPACWRRRSRRWRNRNASNCRRCSRSCWPTTRRSAERSAMRLAPAAARA